MVLPFLTLVPPSDPLDRFHRPWSWQGVSWLTGCLCFMRVYRLSSMVLPFLTLVPPSDPLDLSHRPWLWQRVSMVDRLLVLLECVLLVLHCPVLSESCSSP
jgi:hypothetical protein